MHVECWHGYANLCSARWVYGTPTTSSAYLLWLHCVAESYSLAGPQVAGLTECMSRLTTRDAEAGHWPTVHPTSTRSTRNPMWHYVCLDSPTVLTCIICIQLTIAVLTSGLQLAPPHTESPTYSAKIDSWNSFCHPKTLHCKRNTLINTHIVARFNCIDRSLSNVFTRRCLCNDVSHGYCKFRSDLPMFPIYIIRNHGHARRLDHWSVYSCRCLDKWMLSPVKCATVLQQWDMWVSSTIPIGYATNQILFSPLIHMCEQVSWASIDLHLPQHMSVLWWWHVWLMKIINPTRLQLM